MWNPFKRKKALEAAPEYILAKKDGLVTAIMYDYVEVEFERYYTKKPLVQLGRMVKKGQPVGK